ncbi:putative bifunctional diguanylate cyclase/phosphodiesterase [Sedimenticola selenatireducens]|uniref:cyclic-guanylate-specific phosphodiesterase n=1 Tax=Sedimenticola selenatireducens TaxID=191960 RepID=A0A557SH21_9GAMM|nr:GGDEF domain-containing phosphodiesterase [Sedimenticola selenatireducens]TVO76703.1 EAL domain-containing protein [Sedimenticola selenatireducens]TVT64146.1 MAG: EAL domain-containing protein [Sedimenticola selenatireducens]
MYQVNNQTLSPHDFLEHLTNFISQSDTNCALMLVTLDGMQHAASLIGALNAERETLSLLSRLGKGLRPADTVLRLGRFEFAILLSGILNRGHAVLAANKISGILGKPIIIDNKERNLPFSVGLALSPEHSINPEKLWQHADLAAITARQNQEPYRLFSFNDAADVITHWDIESDLERAITNDEFSLHYQPKFCTKTKQIIGAEGLIRWHHPTHGIIPPDRFIPVAEKIGVISKLTWWVLNTALRESRQWGNNAKNMSIAINISALDLMDKSFIKSVSNATGLWNIPPELLTLEITEGALMRDIAFSANILRKIREHGIKVSIDDFGTGYSSLAYFKQLPADELKIDRSFILNILNDELDQHVVSTIIQMAKKMNLDTVAEGVESASVQKILTELGCDTIQGYHIAKPMPQQDFIEWISERA